MFSTKMASCTSTLYSSPSTLRRRLPLVGAFCMLTLGLSNLYTPLYSSALKTRSKLSSRFSTNSIRMEGSTNNITVPSIVVYVTVPNKEAGKKLAESIVTEKLAACVNRVPGRVLAEWQDRCRVTWKSWAQMNLENNLSTCGGIESVYQWEGKIQTDSEELLIIKTRQSLLEALTDHVKANHEYDVPEVISLPISGGNLKYLEWLKESTRE